MSPHQTMKKISEITYLAYTISQKGVYHVMALYYGNDNAMRVTVIPAKNRRPFEPDFSEYIDLAEHDRQREKKLDIIIQQLNHYLKASKRPRLVLVSSSE